MKLFVYYIIWCWQIAQDSFRNGESFWSASTLGWCLLILTIIWNRFVSPSSAFFVDLVFVLLSLSIYRLRKFKSALHVVRSFDCDYIVKRPHKIAASFDVWWLLMSFNNCPWDRAYLRPLLLAPYSHKFWWWTCLYAVLLIPFRNNTTNSKFWQLIEMTKSLRCLTSVLSILSCFDSVTVWRLVFDFDFYLCLTKFCLTCTLCCVCECCSIWCCQIHDRPSTFQLGLEYRPFCLINWDSLNKISSSYQICTVNTYFSGNSARKLFILRLTRFEK